MGSKVPSEAVDSLDNCVGLPILPRGGIASINILIFEWIKLSLVIFNKDCLDCFSLEGGKGLIDFLKTYGKALVYFAFNSFVKQFEQRGVSPDGSFFNKFFGGKYSRESTPFFWCKKRKEISARIERTDDHQGASCI